MPNSIEGNFNYTNSRLQFNTTEPSFIQVQANVPLPTRSLKGDRFNINAKLTTEAFALVDAVTNGQVNFLGGEGEVTLDASGNLNLGQSTPLSNLTAKGNATLQNATLKSAAFPEPLNLNTQIALNNQLLEVKQLQGSFAKSKLSASGVLPLLKLIGNLSNPLTIAIDKGEIDLTGLYKGDLDGNIIVTGAALKPVFGGKINLKDGQAFIPASKSETDTNNAILARQATRKNAQNSKNIIVPKFNNFQSGLLKLTQRFFKDKIIILSQLLSQE